MRSNPGPEVYPASMRQTRLVFMAAAGVLGLCAIVMIGSLMDYVSHPETANVHVPPVVGTPAPLPVDETPVPLPPPIAAPVSTDQPGPAPTRPAAAQRGRLTLSQLLQLIQAQRRRRPPPG